MGRRYITLVADTALNNNLTFCIQHLNTLCYMPLVGKKLCNTWIFFLRFQKGEKSLTSKYVFVYFFFLGGGGVFKKEKSH